MTKTYPSKTAYGLLAFVFLVFYGPLVLDFARHGYSPAMLGVIAFLTSIFGFVAHLFFATAYTIRDGRLHIKCGFISYAPIDIADIKEISKTNSLLAAPAPSFDRIEIRHGKFGSVVISPKDKEGLARHLVSINPNINNRLAEVKSPPEIR